MPTEERQSSALLERAGQQALGSYWGAIANGRLGRCPLQPVARRVRARPCPLQTEVGNTVRRGVHVAGRIDHPLSHGRPPARRGRPSVGALGFRADRDQAEPPDRVRAPANKVEHRRRGVRGGIRPGVGPAGCHAASDDEEVVCGDVCRDTPKPRETDHVLPVAASNIEEQVSGVHVVDDAVVRLACCRREGKGACR
jgi:hypothetical protein